MNAINVGAKEIPSHISWWSDSKVVPKPGRGSIAVWLRNFLYFKQTIAISVFWAVLEPVLYLVAIGMGLGGFVGNVDGVAYTEFFYPALLCSTAMTLAFFETTYGSFTKLAHQKTFSTILLSPVTIDELVIGEILWGASKSFFGVVCVSIVAIVLGVGNAMLIGPALLVLALTCWLFAAIGMIVTSVARNYDSFVYSVSGFIIPMTLFSGTYYPLNSMPTWAQSLAQLLPLTHAVGPVRGQLLGRWENSYWISIGILVVLAWPCTAVAVARLRRKLDQ
jgi:lipooligosaccharide transport system permease protein